MDPVTAIGLASSLIAFVDFSWSLVTGVKEIYSSLSGATAEHDDINNVVRHLQDLTNKLSTAALGDSEDASTLKTLVFKCRELSSELLGLLLKLKVTGKRSMWKAILAKWHSIRKKDEIASIQQRLGEYRSQILLHLTVMFIGEQSIIKFQLNKLTAEGERVLTSRLSELDILQSSLVSVLTQSNSVVSQSSPQLLGNQYVSSSSVDQVEILRRIKQPLLDLVGLFWQIPRECRILKSIYYDSMHHREEDVHDAEAGTVSWFLDGNDTVTLSSPSLPLNSLLMEQQDSRQNASEKLVNWLRSGSGILHLSGKAGSGKSTAMKLICHHGRTSKELKCWAEGKTLVVAHFFFWNSGEAMQMSEEGLYRSILFEVLKACPELIPEVFPKQWAVLDNRSTSSTSIDRMLFESSHFRPLKIKEAFMVLLEKNLDSKYRLCLFIDGLDELHGESMDHYRLADNLVKWSSKDNIKLCVSSRPHIEFLGTFPEENRLHLHHLNRHDIYTFSCHMFEKDRNFKRVAGIYQKLVSGILENSEGVFLWAYLVVRILLTSINRYDSEATLYEMIEVLPKELSSLYEKLLSSLQPWERRRANLMLSIALKNSRLGSHQYPLTALAFPWVNDLAEPSFPDVKTLQPPWSSQEIADRYEEAKTQINSITKGLLEVSRDPDVVWAPAPDELPGHRVHFFHRTVREYLSISDLCNNEAADWLETYARLRVAEISVLDYISLEPGFKPKNTKFSGWLCSIFDNYRQDHKESRLPSMQLMHQFRNVYQLQSRPLKFSISLDIFNPVNPYGFSPTGSFSFIHFAAFNGHADYVLAEIEDGNSEVSDTPQCLSLLASSALGRNPNFDLISSLLSKGFSPISDLKLHLEFLNSIDPPTYIFNSIWMLFIGQLVCDLSFMNSLSSHLEERCRILLAFLENGVDHEIVIVAGSHVCTLEEMVLACKPANVVPLETWFVAHDSGFSASLRENVLPAWLSNVHNFSWVRNMSAWLSKEHTLSWLEAESMRRVIDDMELTSQQRFSLDSKSEHFDVNSHASVRVF